MLIGLLFLLASAGAPGPAETDACPEAVVAVAASTASPEWVGVLTLDVLGDERPEVFLADTDRGGNAGEPWRLYRLDDTGEYRVVDTVFFHPLGFRAEGSRLDTYWRLNAGSGRFLSYRVSEESIEEIETTDLLEVGDPEFDRRWELILAWRPNLQGNWFVAQVEGGSDSETKRVVCRSLR